VGIKAVPDCEDRRRLFRRHSAGLRLACASRRSAIGEGHSNHQSNEGMQLHLTIEELELLRWLVNDEYRLSCDARIQSAQLSPQPFLQDGLEIGRDLVGKGLTRNLQLGFDELEDLVDLLTRRKNQLTQEMSRMAEPTERSVLEQDLSILNHLLEKVTEACAMV
jgi:hypothetical protein